MGSGRVVVDVDSYKGGDEGLFELERERGKLADGPIVLTGGGGRHLYFAGNQRVGKLADGVDFRGEGSYVLLPPSRHVSGGVYTWEISSGIDEPFRPLPDAWSPNGHRSSVPRELPQIVHDGEERWRKLCSLAGTLVARGFGEPEVVRLVGDYNREHCRPPKPDTDVRRIVHWVIEHDGRTDLQEDQSSQVPAVRGLADVRRTFTDHFHMPDADVVDVALATVVAHRMPGDPLWLMLVGPPGGGKTEVIQSLSDLPEVHPLSSLTAQTFASGLKGNARASLLRRLEEDGKSFLTLKDFTSVLTLHREARAEILSQLRELFDGQYRKEFGSGFSVEWAGRLGLSAGVTPIIDAHHSVTAVLGERFVYYRLPPAQRQVLTQRALKERTNKAEIRRELKSVVRGFLQGLKPDPSDLDEPTTDWLVAAADFASWARSGVLRDGYDRSIAALPEPEVPTRIAQQLAALYSSLRALGNPEGEAVRIVAKVADDSVPRARLELVRRLAGAEELATGDLAESIGLSTDTTKERLEDLLALRLVDRRGEQGKAHQWRLTEDGRRAWDGSRQ